MSEEIKDKKESMEDEYAEHDFDGIKELNNKAPVWIILLFMVTIGFAGIYAIQYFGYPDNEMDQISLYNKKVEAHEAKANVMREESAEMNSLNPEEMLANGKKHYTEKGCVACHGMNGEGNAIGPNLTDNFWLNGCSEEDIIKIIAEGKPEKGMTPYKSMLSETQIKEITAYIQKSLLGSNPENGKEAQGEECIES